jgi:uncharacterized protein YjiS (DUF1127 family)
MPGSATTHPLDLTAKQIGVAVLRLVGRALIRVGNAVYVWQERAAQKRALRDLDERMLRDLGLARADIDRAFVTIAWRAR